MRFFRGGTIFWRSPSERRAGRLCLTGKRFRRFRLGVECVEPRLLLSHAAPLMNTADRPALAAVAENTPTASNNGSTGGAMLASLGPIVSAPTPLGNNFLG